MRILNYDESYLKEVTKLFNENNMTDNFYCSLKEEEMAGFLHNHPEFSREGTFIAFDDYDNLIGIVASHIRHIEATDESKPGYISLLLVRRNMRTRKIAESLLSHVYEYMRKNNKKKVQFGYRSTINYPWYIPSTKKHTHAGAPGVRINTDLYWYLFHQGFEVIDEQDAFHLELKDYKTPVKVEKDLQKAKEEGITIELYDKTKHVGINEFYDDIQDEAFERVIRYNLSKEQPLPFNVVVKDNKVKGWTGAFYTEPSGRAHFDGIIISKEVRGKGLGRALFASLAQYSKANGSEYMTFFTGRHNFARYIYQELGFKIIYSFAVMEKTL